ncbi:MAG: glycosyltransferase family 2 protein [Bacteroidia bacterium]|nr:glycosyltransferase family 2 protein [Bacteroidia bacterium]
MVFGPFLAKRRASRGASPWITVCIPARNEGTNIQGLLDALEAQDWENFDVLVLDDESTDNTAALVEAASSRWSAVSLIKGNSLPPGWTGKNWACHQLSEQARGDVLLFMDADVRPEISALSGTVGAMHAYRADVLSAFPRQLLRGIASRLIVPVMDVLLYAFLPMQLVHRTRFSSLSAANGQWIAFTRKSYVRVGGHAAVRSEIVEDIRLAQRSKQLGLRMLLMSGVGAVNCRMYNSGREVLEGFSKNFFAAFNFNVVAFGAAHVLLLLLFVAPYVALAVKPSVLASVLVLLNLLLRSFLALRLRHGMVTVLLHPFGILAAVGIGIHAVWQRYARGAVRWKGRTIPVRGSDT